MHFMVAMGINTKCNVSDCLSDGKGLTIMQGSSSLAKISLIQKEKYQWILLNKIVTIIR